MSRKKSALKAVSYRLFGSLTTMAVVFIFSGEIKIAGSVALIDVVSKVVLYYLHERMWESLPFKILASKLAKG